MVKSTKQKMITQSSTEAELLGLTEGIKRSLHLAKFMNELGFTTKLQVTAMQDNQSTIMIAKHGEGMGGKAKHFRVRYHFIKELIDEGVLKIEYCSSGNMIPDFLTKGMTGEQLYYQICRAMYHNDAEVFRRQAEMSNLRVTNNIK